MVSEDLESVVTESVVTVSEDSESVVTVSEDSE